MKQSDTTTTFSPVDFPAQSEWDLNRANQIMRYWNQNQFEGRFKTRQTEWAEQYLIQIGIDPSKVGMGRKVTVTIQRPAR